MLEKLKSWLADDSLFYAALLILVALASFGLGRQSVAQKTPLSEPVQSERVGVVKDVATSTKTTPLPVTTAVAAQSAAVIGSKSGTKYHLPTCPGAKQIKPANVITFDSAEAAQAAGYTPAANCPGLQ